MTSEIAAHIALRIPLVAKVVGRHVEVVAAHNKVVSYKGKVALAKLGLPLSPLTVTVLEDQIKNGIETNLILIGKRGINFFGFTSRISAIYKPKTGGW